MEFHDNRHTRGGHVHLAVKDLQNLKHFYKEVIGLDILSENEKAVYFTADGRVPLVILEEKREAGPADSRAAGLYHFALLLPARSDLASVMRHLSEFGYPLRGASDHQFSEALYLDDPEGNQIEIYCDRPKEVWDWQDGELPFVSDPLDAEGILNEGQNQKWSGLPNQTVLGHIHLFVNDLNSAKDFYCDGLGFDITIPFRNNALFVSSGGYHHHIGLNTWKGHEAPAPDPGSLGMQWYSIIFAKSEEREAAISRLQLAGNEVWNEHGMPFTKDPSGNVIKLLV
ncbi:catechol 2,3-dioxygenase [Bacillus sp. OV322]|uniref:VOC family protein n=1 Tax=Bacillus sp. OV322 TaxID=1882764 RepID=UPI0008F2C1D8|nr:VOC family protein [Bacillus sp. OV322]SFC79149.1 catechol 2,3-dioxygenase [Bacillus sp. OV322]